MEMEREEVEARVRAAVARNQEVLRAVPEGASDVEYWGALLREGQPVRLRVRRLDSGPPDEQSDIYLLEETGGYVELTYFRGDEVAEAFSVEMDRIEWVE